MNPNLPKAYVDKSISLNKKGLNDLAIASLDKAIAVDPAYKNAYTMRGAIYFNMKNYTASKKDIEKVLELEPGNKFAVNLLAKINALPPQ